ncbi:hypothetical protein VDGD_21448 [Verticillium dahliae]|nr:hypothetical protein VDGD_21448 [Verticillium dahliae]
MKGSLILAAAAAAGVSASNAHRHAHGLFKRTNNATEICLPGCTTIYKTIYGEPTRTYTQHHPLWVMSSSSTG